jgi:hypothetical protein
VAGTSVVGMVIDVPESELGSAVLMALAGSRADQPHPTNLTEVGRLVLDAAGKRTWRALEKSAVLVQVRRDGVVIRVVPTRNGGTAGDDRGFHELADRASVLEHDAPSTEIARAVLAALSSCY